jgi:hypothetical protein
MDVRLCRNPSKKGVQGRQEGYTFAVLPMAEEVKNRFSIV